MIVGEYIGKIGEKKRISLPKKIREEIGNQLILTRGYEDCLVLVNKEMWKGIARDVIGGSFINQNIRETSRFLVGSAIEIELDIQGRFVIPQTLFEHARFSNDIVFVGLINWIEVWDKERWEEKMKELQNNSQQIANELINATKNG